MVNTHFSAKNVLFNNALYFKLLTKGLHKDIWIAPIFMAEQEFPRENCGKEKKEGKFSGT